MRWRSCCCGASKTRCAPETPNQDIRYCHHLLSDAPHLHFGQAVFAGLPVETLQEAVAVMRPKTLKEGATVIRQGDDADAFYVIEKGKVLGYLPLRASVSRRQCPRRSPPPIPPWPAVPLSRHFSRPRCAAMQCGVLQIQSTEPQLDPLRPLSIYFKN